MSAKLFIHIGTHKTGSTTIQRTLSKHSAQLRKEGIIYIPVLPVFKELTRSRILDKEIIQRGRDQLEEQICHYQGKISLSFVLSYEGFSGDPMLGYSNADSIAESLAHITYDFGVNIIVYLRRQDEFVESLYTQKIHEGEAYTFGEFLQKFRHSTFNWESLLNSYSKCFGKESIRLRIYHKRVLPNRDSLIRDFGRVIHSETLSGYTRSVVANPGYSRDALEIARLTNPYLNDADKRRLRRILQETNAKKPFESYSFFPTRTRQEFLSHYAESNANVAREYLNQHPQPLFPPPDQDSNCQTYQGLKVEGVAVVFARALLARGQDKDHLNLLGVVTKMEKYVIRKLSQHPRVKRLVKWIAERFRLL